jgi:hypothetical protein
MLVIRTDNSYDYVDNYMLDSLIKSKEIVKFKRNSDWVAIGAEPMKGSGRDNAVYDTPRLAINDLIFVSAYRGAH